MSKIHQIPNQPASPETILAQLMEFSDQIKNIVIVAMPHKGPTEVFYNQMRDGDIAWIRWCVDQDFRPTMPGDEQ